MQFGVANSPKMVTLKIIKHRATRGQLQGGQNASDTLSAGEVRPDSGFSAATGRTTGGTEETNIPQTVFTL